MTGGLMKTTTSRLALAAIASMVATGAYAADLGGNCCADLEERVSELEATTARKGNRKVSLTVYGQVNKAIVWHDSDRRDAYRPDQITVRDNDASMSRFGFRGSANLNADWSMTYNIEIGVQENFGRNTDSQNPAIGDPGANFVIRHNVVRFVSKTWGTFGLGQTSTASDGAFEVNLANIQGITNLQTDALEPMLGAAYGGFASGIDGTRRQGIYYTSPTFAGFAFSAGWFNRDQDARFGNDTALEPCPINQATANCDTATGWDVALRYAGEFNGIRLAAAIAYREDNSTNDTLTAGVYNGADVQSFMTSGSMMHVPTGLFLSGGWGKQNSDTASRDSTQWWLQSGIQQNWFGIGTTTLYAEYGSVEFGAANLAGGSGSDVVGWNNNARRDGNYWGLGITQNLSAAAADLYINYRNYEIDARGPGATGAAAGSDASAIVSGAIIRF